MMARLVLALLPMILIASLLSPRPAAAIIFGGAYESTEEEILLRIGERELEFRNFAEARAVAAKAMERFPESPEAVRLAALAAFEQRALQVILQEIREREEAGTISPHLAHYARGLGATLIGDARTSLRELERARALAPKEIFEFERAWLVARRNLPNRDDAAVRRDSFAFVQRYQNIPLAHSSFLNTLRILGASDSQLRSTVESAFSLGVRSPELWATRIDLEIRRFWGDPARALVMVEEAIAEFPESLILGQRRAEALARLGRWEEGLEEIQQRRLAAPNNGDLRLQEINFLTELNRWEEAIALSEAFTREITDQESLRASHPPRHAFLLHEANRRDEALAVLNDFLRLPQAGFINGNAETLRNQILTSSAEDRVVFLDPIASVTQRGNFCGPASLSMVLASFGLNRGQDTIARTVYTGIAGTPPQVIEHYVRALGFRTAEFTQTEERWKALIDAGFPILWLQMLGSRGAHYRVVAGYDQIRNEWIVYDPNDVGRIRISFDDVDDLWILPQLRRSLIIYPKEMADDPLIASLRPTMLLRVTNFIMYTATGSNLFVGLFPALFINLFGAAILCFIVTLLVARISYPRRLLRFGPLFFGLLSVLVLLNLVIGIFRLSEAVSLLLALHLALITLIPILLFVFVSQRALNDSLHPRETVGLVAIIAVMWACLSFVDRDPWQWLIPLAVFLVGFPAAIWPRVLIRRAETFALRNDGERALSILGPLASTGKSYYTAICLELECLLRTGRLERLAEQSESLLADEAIPAKTKETVRYLRALALTLLGDRAAEATVRDLLARPLPADLRLHAEILAHQHVGLRSCLQPAETYLVALDRKANSAFRRLIPTRYRMQSLFAEVSWMLALQAAAAEARSKGDEAGASRFDQERFARQGWLFSLERRAAQSSPR